jgi:serine/threonine protein kinase
VFDTPMREPAVLGDRYQLESMIGRGGMADVYRAHDRVLGRDVAVKLMRDAAGSEQDRARFAGEARTLARLNHPGLVTILDAATTDEQPYLVMELVNGPSLADCCAGVALDPDRVAAIGAQLADALAYAHRAGIVHRDIKPGNVLLAEDDRALLTDFGIARLMSDSARHTATGMTIGTAAYLSPEQVRGDEVTPAADVYSLGLVLLEALTGERAYRGSPTEAALARLSSPPQVPESLPTAWQDLVLQMTRLEARERPDAAEVSTTLRDLAAGLEPSTATADLRAASGHTRPLTHPVHADTDAPATAGTMHLRQPRPRRSLPRLGSRVPSVPRRMSWPWVAVVAVVVVVVAAVVALSALTGGPDAGTGTDVPPEVPARLQQPLQDLHDAVEGES